MARKKLGEILITAGVIDDAQLRSALNEQRRWGGPLGRILVDMKLITEEAMVRALSTQLNLPAVNLDQRPIERSALDLVSGELAEQHGVIAFNVQGKFLDVAMSDPTNLGIVDELRIRTRMNVRPYLAGPKAIERALARHYGRGVTRELGGSNFVGSGLADDVQLGGRVLKTQPEPKVVPGLARPATDAAPAAARRRAASFELTESVNQDVEREREIRSLQERVVRLEALVARDEDVLRKLLALFVEKGVATRDEILDRIK